MRFALVASLLSVASATWSLSLAQDAVWYSAAAYCSKDTYKSRSWVGRTAGFVCTDVLYDLGTDTNGYVGYNNAYGYIVVSFRGSQSLRNWITNLEFAKLDMVYPACSGCLVHSGFYNAEQTIISKAISAVKSLQTLHPTYKVLVTGHSLGAALATLTAIDMKNAGISNIFSYHYGSPRIGNQAFMQYIKNVLPDAHRVVHDCDTVPHVPYEAMGFWHICTEFFEDKAGSIKQCGLTCEDSTCGNQYAFSATTVDAHLVYLGMPISDCTYVS
jgi:hypothetical protein